MNGMSHHQSRLLGLRKVAALFPFSLLVLRYGLHEELWGLEQVEVNLGIHWVDFVEFDSRDTAQGECHLKTSSMVNDLPSHDPGSRAIKTTQVGV